MKNKMRAKIKEIRQYVITSLAMSMIVVFWVLCIDALLYGTGKILQTVVSIIVFCFLLVLIEGMIKKYMESQFWLSVLLEFLGLVALFFVFGTQFHWYPKGKEYLFVVYSIPVYIAGYGLRLVGIRKDAEDINRHLELRKRQGKL